MRFFGMYNYTYHTQTDRQIVVLGDQIRSDNSLVPKQCMDISGYFP